VARLEMHSVGRLEMHSVGRLEMHSVGRLAVGMRRSRVPDECISNCE